MVSIGFPNMIKQNQAVRVKDLDATEQNLKTLILSQRKTMFGYPGFGTNLQRLFYDPNNVVIRDIVIDDIYSTIYHYMPQLMVKRSGITIQQDRNSMTIHIVGKNNLSTKLSEYTINLENDEEM